MVQKVTICLIKVRIPCKKELFLNSAYIFTTKKIIIPGWLYKMFVRKLHDKQRRRIIEPLRHRFEEKLKMKDYICNINNCPN